MAYALCLVEQAILKQDKSTPRIMRMLDVLWSFVSLQSLADWDRLMSQDQKGEDLCWLHDHVEVLKWGGDAKGLLPDDSPLLRLGPTLMRMIHETMNLGIIYLYGAVPSGAPKCSEQIEIVYQFGKDFDLREPPITLFSQCQIASESESDIWGDSFSPEPFRAWVRDQVS